MFQFSPSKRKDYHLFIINKPDIDMQSFNLVPPKGRIITALASDYPTDLI